MKTIFEYLFYFGGSLLIWMKLSSIALSFGLILYGCHRLNKSLSRLNLQTRSSL